MPHWRKFTDRDWLYSEDLDGRDVTVTIDTVTQGELIGEGGRKTRKPRVTFRGAKKPLALNATNAKTIATLYGNRTEGWIGKAITLYTSTTQYGGQETECIRVRPMVPSRTVGGRSSPNNLSADDARSMREARTGSAEVPLDDIADSQASEPEVES